ncbi:hypothetical protein D8M34_18170 [Microbacterium sp. HSID17254]|nr:hypothetical protein D8M34_18170 [Microbacterium sp. HSID17254]
MRSSDSSATLPGCDIVVDIADDASVRTQSQALSTNLRGEGLTDSALCDRSRKLANAVLMELTGR